MWDGSQVFPLSTRSLADLPGLRPGEQLQFGVSADHGQGPGKQVFILYAWAGEAETCRVWILGVYRNVGETPLQQDIAAVILMLRGWRLTPSRVARWHGDINAKMNDTITRALRVADPTWHGRMEKADKSSGAVVHGEHVIDDAVGRVVAGGLFSNPETGEEILVDDVPALQVLNVAQDVVGAFETYKGKSRHEKPKNVMDAVRYGVTELLDLSAGDFDFDEANEEIPESPVVDVLDELGFDVGDGWED